MLNQPNVNKLISPFLKRTYLRVDACVYKLSFHSLMLPLSPESTQINLT